MYVAKLNYFNWSTRNTNPSVVKVNRRSPVRTRYNMKTFFKYTISFIHLLWSWYENYATGLGADSLSHAILFSAPARARPSDPEVKPLRSGRLAEKFCSAKLVILDHFQVKQRNYCAIFTHFLLEGVVPRLSRSGTTLRLFCFTNVAQTFECMD